MKKPSHLNSFTSLIHILNFKLIDVILDDRRKNIQSGGVNMAKKTEIL